MCQHIYLKSQESRFMGIIFSNVQSHSVMSDSVTPWTVARQAPLSTRILRTRILEWVYMPSPPGDLPNPGIKPRSPTLQVNSLLSEPNFTQCYKCICSFLWKETKGSKIKEKQVSWHLTRDSYGTILSSLCNSEVY